MIIEQFNSKDYSEIMKVWESSVLETHHFLKDEDFEYFKEVIPRDYLPNLNIYVLIENGLKAFLAYNNNQLEMFFVDAESRGKGFGRILIKYAIDHLNIKYVDVNEQNEQAIGFYKKFGFSQFRMSLRDSSGREYPILHLSLQKDKNKD